MPTTTRFGLTWDYRCPFARIVHEHVLLALDLGAGWEVEFLPFSLSQVHVEEGDVDVWDDPAKARDHLAMEAAIAVQKENPESFPRVHGALFRARHEEGRDLRDPQVVKDVLRESGVEPDAVMGAVEEGWPREEFRAAHQRMVASHGVWGVPTFVVGDRAAFARLMNRPDGDAGRSRESIERIVAMVGDWPELNELKHTTLQN
ncbi:MAG TPA: DsbA family protein [Acidimicrobiales bacterium]|nr:DsbA family protein [Acidimicrobiales bacterium]